MDLTDLVTIKNLAKQKGIHPTRQSGQNFLLSKEVLKKIIFLSKLQKGDKVLEIGPGFGTLTLELLKTGASVFSFESDRNLVNYLAKFKPKNTNFNLFEADILNSWKILNKEFKDLDYKLISNLPYNITSKVLRIFTEDKPRPKEMIIMVQKEVAERVVAKPGQLSKVAVAVQFYGCPKKIFDVPAENFWPQPKVDSSVLHIIDIGKDKNGYIKKLAPFSTKDFFRTVKIGFSAKRKQIHNNLTNGFKIKSAETSKLLSKIGIKPNIRAQDLTIEDWISITHNFCH